SRQRIEPLCTLCGDLGVHLTAPCGKNLYQYAVNDRKMHQERSICDPLLSASYPKVMQKRSISIQR
ncbi:hypothetical protein, partial [Escherichia coli]|uniref:hypothetical protein n=1 Tax=Escherichia coli TaxID=562 RepID=UPI0019D64495